MKVTTATVGLPERELSAAESWYRRVFELTGPAVEPAPGVVELELAPIELRRLRVDGGLTQSTVLMQAVADLMQIPVDVYPSQHGTPLGAATLARVAVNPGLSLEDAIVDWSPTLSFEPQWSSDRASEFSGRWRAIADVSH